MSHHKMSSKLKTVAQNRQEDHSRRLLKNELSDLQAVRDRHAKYMLRDQAEIRKELFRLTEAKRKKQQTLRKQALETAVKQAHDASISVQNKVRSQLSEKYKKLSINGESYQPGTTAVTTEQTSQSQQQLSHFPTKAVGLRSDSLSSSASMISLLSRQAISDKKSHQVPESSSYRLSKQESSNDVEENNNEPITRSQDEKIDTKQSIHELKHETQEKVKSYLTEQGIVVDGSPLINSKVKRITEDIINMRNLGKSTDQIWTDVRNCRYLRGYEPAIMRIPADMTQFVFPDQESMEEYKRHIIKMANTVEQAAKIQEEARNLQKH